MKKTLLLLLTLLISAGCFAQWSKDTLNRNIVCQSGRAYGQLACSDGHKGVIMAWMDQRGAQDRIYMQRLDSNGMAKWTVNGKLMSSPSDQWAYDPIVVSDGHGGAVIFFDISINGGGFHIYAQRVDGNGNELWAAGGVPVSIAQDSRMRNSEDPATNQASADGDGGAFLTWQTYGPFGISAQHIDKNGNAVWPANGIFVTSIDSAIISYGSNIINTGNGTAAVAWGYSNSLFMQRISAAGSFLWTPRGLQVADSFDSRAAYNAAYLMYDSTAATKNVTVTWEDSRNPLNRHDIYAQKIDLNGNFLWKNKGLPVVTSAYDDVASSTLADGKGGFYAICDNSTIACVQHVDKNGTVLWGSNGLQPEGDYNGINPVIADDGSGGIIAMWDFNGKLYAQRYNYGGIAQWRAGGTPVISSTLDSMQVSNNHTVNPIISLEDGTAIAVWSSQIGNVYAAKFGGIDGLLPISFLSFTAECQKQTALLQWTTSQEINSQYFEVQTSNDGMRWATVKTIPAAGTSNIVNNYSFAVANPLPNQLYRLAEYDNNGQRTYSKIISAACVENNSNISLYPNPATNVLNVSTAFATDTDVQLTIYSLLGTVVHSQQYHANAGSNNVTINVKDLAAGTYVLVIKSKAGKTLYSQHFVKL